MNVPMPPGDYNINYNHELELLKFNFEKNMRIFEAISEIIFCILMLLVLYWCLKYVLKD